MNPVDFMIVGFVIIALVWFFTAVKPLGWYVEVYLLFWAAGAVFCFMGLAGMAQHVYNMGAAKGYW